jgi:hypothetical protein
VRFPSSSMTLTAASLGNCVKPAASPRTRRRSANSIWTDFLRRRIKAKDIKADFSSALATALKLAKTKEAGYLPGWCGPPNQAA